MPKRKNVMLTDSACDMPFELEKTSGVDIMNFQITVDGKGYYEREDFDFDAYYGILRTCEGVPSTAHVTMVRFLEQFEKYAAEGVQNVIYVSICKTGSNTFNAATMAREEFYASNPGAGMKIYIVDSRAYSMTYGWYVAEAARKLQNGAEVRSVVDWLEDKFARMEIILGAYTLKYMKKSGRVSAAAAFAGELLGLRPIISLNDGVSVVRKKVRGDREVHPSLLAWAKEHMDETREYMVGGTVEEDIQKLAALCKKELKTPPVCTFKLGAAVATNTGPDAIAIVFVGEKRE